MAIEPQKKEPEIQPPQPDVQPGHTPREIPQNKDIPEKETPPNLGRRDQLLGGITWPRISPA
jgi:hypothetical protein